ECFTRRPYVGKALDSRAANGRAAQETPEGVVTQFIGEHTVSDHASESRKRRLRQGRIQPQQQGQHAARTRRRRERALAARGELVDLDAVLAMAHAQDTAV